MPYKYVYLFDEPRTAHVFFEGNDNVSYNCNIISHNAKLIHREDGNYFMATATVSTQGQNTPILQKYMKADAESLSAIKRYGSRYSDRLYPNTAVCFWMHIVSVSIRFYAIVLNSVNFS